jgi:metal-dependent amidase/aminoacylase/carboxypeptidase family protein
MLPSLQATKGEANVILAPARTGAEDFSFYQEKFLTFLFFRGMPIGKDVTETASHQPDFYIDEQFCFRLKQYLTVDYMNLNATKIRDQILK